MTPPRIEDLDPSSTTLNSRRRAFTRALRLFREAAERVPAYKDFLKKARVRPSSIETEEDFAHVPLTDKPHYFSAYNLAELSWDGSLERSKYISTSSGSTGIPFFWPRGEEQDRVVGQKAQHLYTRIFDAQTGPTLFVNSFSLGTWIAGIEFFNAARWSAEHGTPLTIITPGIDKHETVRQIKKLSPLFSRIILAGYPPFIKDILEYGIECGIDWDQLDVRLLFAGEAVSETWRSWVLKMIGKNPNDLTLTANIYGMAESGVVAHETPLSQLVRRSLSSLTSPELPAATRVTGLYQFYPRARYFEVVDRDSLVLTANAGLPLIRYSTRDNGGVLWQNTLPASIHDHLLTLAREHAVPLTEWRLPFVYLYGRKDLSISLYALIIYNENVKYALEHSRYYARVSGLFTMSVVHTKQMDQRFKIIIELSPGTRPTSALRLALTDEIAKNIRVVNSEYAKLCSAVGKRAQPHLTLVPYGEIQTVRGKKHRWVQPTQR
ncbi:MAG: hypothetical protein AAB442_01220 [Patescibacteria group bacterium]